MGVVCLAFINRNVKYNVLELYLKVETDSFSTPLLAFSNGSLLLANTTKTTGLRGGEIGEQSRRSLQRGQVVDLFTAFYTHLSHYWGAEANTTNQVLQPLFPSLSPFLSLFCALYLSPLVPSLSFSQLQSTNLPNWREIIRNYSPSCLEPGRSGQAQSSLDRESEL